MEKVLEKRHIHTRYNEDNEVFYQVEFETHYTKKNIFGQQKFIIEKKEDCIIFYSEEEAKDYIKHVCQPSVPFYRKNKLTNDATVYPTEWMSLLQKYNIKEPVIERYHRCYQNFWYFIGYRAVLHPGTDNEYVICSAKTLSELLVDLPRTETVKRILQQATPVPVDSYVVNNDNTMEHIPVVENENADLYRIRNNMIQDEIDRIEKYKDFLQTLKK